MDIDRDIGTSPHASGLVACFAKYRFKDSKKSVEAIDTTFDDFHAFYYSLRPAGAF